MKTIPFFLSLFLLFFLFEEGRGGFPFGNEALLEREKEWMERKEKREKKEMEMRMKEEAKEIKVQTDPIKLPPFKGLQEDGTMTNNRDNLFYASKKMTPLLCRPSVWKNYTEVGKKKTEKEVENVKGRRCFTVIITGNAIPSHPNPHIIMEVIDSLNTLILDPTRFRSAPLILAHDTCLSSPLPPSSRPNTNTTNNNNNNKKKRLRDSVPWAKNPSFKPPPPGLASVVSNVVPIPHGLKSRYNPHGGVTSFAGSGKKQIVKKHNCENFQGYLENLKEIFEKNDRENLLILSRKSKEPGLMGSITEALEYVNTEYVLVIQHDLAFSKRIHLGEIMGDMDREDQLRHVKFGWLPNKALPDKSRCEKSSQFGFGLKLPRDDNNDNKHTRTYTKTPCWSDNNHLTTKEYYEQLVIPYVPANDFMEKVIRYKPTENHPRYGTWLYGSLTSRPFTVHLDGRMTKK